jgi:hypothetical protein
MLEAVKKIVKSALFREVLRVVLAALAGYSASGCAALGMGPDHPSLSVLACKAEVLAPYVGDAADEVARSIDGDRAFDVVGFLQSQGLSIPEIIEVAKRYQACVPEPEPVTAPAEASPVDLTRV